VPLLLIEAGQDTSLPVGDAAQLLAAAQAAGVDASLERCDAAAHGQAASSCPDAYRDRVLAFLARAFSAAP
jgi:dienelactone hydrolase